MSIVLPRSDAEKTALLAGALKRLPYAISAELAYPVAVVRDGQIAAVCVYHEWRGLNIEMSIAADTPRWASKQTVAFLLGFPFFEFGVRRITAMVARKNKPSRKLVEGLGFHLEGVMRDCLATDDLVIYGMTRRTWERGRWYREPAVEQRAA